MRQQSLRSGKYLLELINDILDISKIEAGKMEVHAETFDLAKLVHEIASTIRPLTQKRTRKATAWRRPPTAGPVWRSPPSSSPVSSPSTS